MSSVLRARIMAETSAWWALCAPPCPPPEDPPDAPVSPPATALVARPVLKPAVRSSPSAQAALSKEWRRLWELRCWDEGAVEEWDAVRAHFQASGQKCHVGRLFDICVEKNSDLAPGHPSRKFKGRFVFEGNYVRDEYRQAALFRELGANPASMDALRLVDAYSLLDGHVMEQADAQQAYAQAKLQGAPTWVEVPEMPCLIHGDHTSGQFALFVSLFMGTPTRVRP